MPPICEKSPEDQLQGSILMFISERSYTPQKPALELDAQISTSLVNFDAVETKFIKCICVMVILAKTTPCARESFSQPG